MGEFKKVSFTHEQVTAVRASVSPRNPERAARSELLAAARTELREELGREPSRMEVQARANA